MCQELFFFCGACKDKKGIDSAASGCTIPHKVKHFKQGEYIAYQGEQVKQLYMLTRGRVHTELVSSSGLSLPMEDIVAPFPLAAAFLFADNNQFPVDVIAMEDCELLLISKEAIEEKMAGCRGFMRGFLAFNANRMQYLSERLKLFAQKSIKAKMAYYILAHEQEGKLILGVSLTLLAQYFGVERPSLSRAISEMVREGIIVYQAKTITVIDFKALEELFL